MRDEVTMMAPDSGADGAAEVSAILTDGRVVVGRPSANEAGGPILVPKSGQNSRTSRRVPARRYVTMHRLASPLMILIATLASGVSHAGGWAKYVVPDGSFSIHYPAGWRATVDEGSVEFSCEATGERIRLLSLQADVGDTPRAIAERVIDLLRQSGIPDVTVKDWRESDQPETNITFLGAYTEEGRLYLADVLVAKTGDGALWVSYSVPAADYSPSRSQTLFAAMLGSLSAGDQSAAPDAMLPELATEQMDTNARAFLFVLEFAIGAPFAATQERIIIDAYKSDIGQLGPTERAQFDAYPALVAKIMGLGQADVEPYRHELRKTMREAISEAEDSPAFRVLNEELDRSGEVVAAGPPPLVRVAAQATGEMLAYGRLLGEDPTAKPDDLDPRVAAAIRDETIFAWDSLDGDTKKLATDAPGMWMVVRTVMRTGQPAEQAALRAQLKGLASAQVRAAQAPEPPAATPANAGQTGSTSSWVTHNALMSMNQMTFNTNMWSNGYSGWSPMGKIW